MFLGRVRMYLFNMVMILRTHQWYVIHVHLIMTLHRRKCYLIHSIMAPPQSKTNLLRGAFAQHPTVGPQVSHFLNGQPVSGFYLLTYEIQIAALYLPVCAPCVSFMSCHRNVVWHYPSLKGIREPSPQTITYSNGVPLMSIGYCSPSGIPRTSVECQR